MWLYAFLNLLWCHQRARHWRKLKEAKLWVPDVVNNSTCNLAKAPVMLWKVQSRMTMPSPGPGDIEGLTNNTIQRTVKKRQPYSTTAFFQYQ
ncbi:hypothetical protein M514_00255 [Trichuris suis]|uniref:Uncharacterized protein n=1 Tax=Trichuris suis TaxID=68888 RepID=A0A085NEF9_9BILA|nr:hypothetical protein M513_00255 [Trichuris suis]KFD67855.1 hypothetical protein M514_00255 [Trichuris suis]